MPLPNFLIIGAQKSGTTWLAKNLRSHPEVYMPRKEIHYFDKEYNFKKGIVWYKNHFSGARDERAVGEKTPDYIWANGCAVEEGHLPNVHKNIFQTLPAAKLIIVLRNPVERAISAVNHVLRSGSIYPFLDFDELLLGNKQQLLDRHGVIDKGKYYQQINAYYDYFDRKQVMILIFEEDIIKDSFLGLRKVCQYLNISPDFEFEKRDKKYNKFVSSKLDLMIRYYVPFMRPYMDFLSRRLESILPSTKTRPSKTTLLRLYKVYEEDNKKLFDLLGRSIASWGIDQRNN